MGHKRRSPRRMCIGRVDLLVQANGREVTEKGMIQDKSKMGLGIKIRRAIEPGSVISLVQGFTTRLVIVRHCTPIKRAFMLGIEWYTPKDLVPVPEQAPCVESVENLGPEGKIKRVWN